MERVASGVEEFWIYLEKIISVMLELKVERKLRRKFLVQNFVSISLIHPFFFIGRDEKSVFSCSDMCGGLET